MKADYITFIQNKSDLLGIYPYAKKVLQFLKWDYKEYTSNKSNNSFKQTEMPEILNLLIKGLSNSQIAEKLSIAEGTVKNILNEYYSQYNISGNTKGKREKLKEILRNQGACH